MSDETTVRERVPRLTLNSIPNTRRTLSRIIRARAAGKLTDSTYRSLVWGLGGLLAYWRLESDLSVEERLDRLESRLDDETRKRGVA